MTHIRMILKHVCLSGMLGITQSKITWFWGYIFLPLLFSVSLISPNFDVKSIIFSQFWPGAIYQFWPGAFSQFWPGAFFPKLLGKALSAWLNQQNELCPQRRLSSAWVSTQSDQLSDSVRLQIKEWLDSPQPLYCVLEQDRKTGNYLNIKHQHNTNKIRPWGYFSCATQLSMKVILLINV